MYALIRRLLPRLYRPLGQWVMLLPLLLAACQKTTVTVSLYQNADECKAVHPSQTAQCATAYYQALAEAERSAPKYASQMACEAVYGAKQCLQTLQVTDPHHHPLWMPVMTGFMLGVVDDQFKQTPLFTSRQPDSPFHNQFIDANGARYGDAVGQGRELTVPLSVFAPKPLRTTPQTTVR